MRSVTVTDIIQFVVLATTVPLVCAASLGKVGGLGNLIAQIPPQKLEILNDDIYKNIGIFLAFALPFMSPPVTQRILMAKTWQHAQMSFRWCAMLSIPFFFFVGIIGFVALVTNPDLNPNLAMPYLVSEILPVGFRGLAISGIIAVIMSSADSYLNSGSISFVHDVLGVARKDPLSDAQQVLAAKIITMLMGFGAIWAALYSSSITDILLGTLSFWGPVVLTPLMAGIFGIVGTPRTFWITVSTGLASYFLWDSFGKEAIGLSALIPSIAASCCVFFPLAAIDRKALPQTA